MNTVSLILSELGWQAWFTAVTVLVMLVLLVRSSIRPVIIIPGCLLVLITAGILTPEAAFFGFSNSAVLTIGALYVVAAGVQHTNALGFLDRLLFSSSRRPGWVLARFSAVTAFLSAFLNNTPLVSMLIPRVEQWADHRRIPVSKFLIPLSYAAVLGGMVTLIGTSTNLLVAGWMESSGLQPLTTFDLARVGIPVTLAGILYLSTLGHRLLPDRSTRGSSLEGGLKDYVFELKVEKGSPLTGKTIERAGLRSLDSTYLIHVRRKGQIIPSTPHEVVLEEDELAFVGGPREIDRLLRIPGVGPVLPSVENPPETRTLPLYEVVVAASSRLVGKTLREVSFREQYEGVVLAIQRFQERIQGPLGRAVLKPGDLLLIEAANGFEKHWKTRRDEFYYVAPRRPEQVKPASYHAPLALAILGIMVTVSALEIFPIVTAAFAAAIIMVISGCVKEADVRKAIDLPVLIILASALGIGQALETSGIALAGASLLQSLTSGLGPVALLAAVYIFTNLLTELITNHAAAVLMLPIGMTLALQTALPPEAVAVTIAIAASAGFMTPLGYQTHLMVASAGAYRFSDFLKVGALLNLIVMIVAITVISFLWT